ncbi:Malate dehydrogenase [Rickettsiales bacterium Ac37b]|nr:Malate dehydrogenase [Rickettsiales bacterium Ac37b]
MDRKRIGIIGAGDIGLNLAEIMALQGYDVVVFNRYHAVDNKPSPYWLSKMGTIMDMNDSLQLPNCGEVSLTSDLSDLSNVNIIVITAGAKRTNTAETREELAGKNARIMDNYINIIAENPNTLILIISNPVDFLTQYLINKISEVSGQTKDKIAQRIIGVSYIDTMRLQNLIREFLKTSYPSIIKPKINAIVLGEHGPSMVPITSNVTINGKLLSELASLEQIDYITSHTILRGNDIIKLTGASSVVGPSHAVMHMITNILNDKEALLPCSIWDGKRSIGKLAKFVDRYFTDIIEINISNDEKEKLHISEQTLDTQYKKIMTYLE